VEKAGVGNIFWQQALNQAQCSQTQVSKATCSREKCKQAILQ